MSADNTVEEKSRRRRRREDNGEEFDEMDSERGLSDRKGRATPGRRTAVTTEKKGGNFLSRWARGAVEYFKGVNDELSKVVWPDRADTLRLTRIVLAVTIASSLALGFISFLFTELFVIGIRNNQPVIFLVLGVIVAAVYFFWNRLSARDSSPY